MGGASPALRGIMGKGWVGHLLHREGKQVLWGGDGWGISFIERASRRYGEGVGGVSPALRGQAGIMGRGWVGHLLH